MSTSNRTNGITAGSRMATGTIVAVLALAVVGVANVAFAQVKVGSDGRALDANTRVGSGGYNTPRPNLQLANPNDIALDNVTGGRGFRGNLTGDPSQPFGGRSNLPTDRLNRASNPQQGPGAPPLPPGTYATKYYSSSPVGNAPTGFALNPYTGRYQPEQKLVQGGEDIQFGLPPGTPVIRPGADGSSQLVLPAMLRDANGAAMPVVMTATPLLGVRQLPQLEDGDQYLLLRSANRNEQALSPEMVRKLRAELSKTMVSDPRLAEELRQAEKRADAKEDASLAPLIRSAKVGDGAVTDPTFDPAIKSGRISAPAAGSVDMTKAVDPADNNPLLSELRKAESERNEKLKKAGEKGGTAPGNTTFRPQNPADAVPSITKPGDKKADEKSADEKKSDEKRTSPKNTDEKKSDEKKSDTKPGDSDKTPNLDTLPPPELNPGPGGIGYVPPIDVGSLADKQSRSGMKELLAGGEKLMVEGKYASAADRFAAAMQFAPGDATIRVARAQAELGAGFFARAEAQLAAAVSADASVLGARYDLKKLLGEERVAALAKDLKKLATEDKENAMPVVLLAYIAYNSGDGIRSLTLLGEAKRRDPNNELANAMSNRWSGTTDSTK